MVIVRKKRETNEEQKELNIIEKGQKISKEELKRQGWQFADYFRRYLHLAFCRDDKILEWDTKTEKVVKIYKP